MMNLLAERNLLPETINPYEPPVGARPEPSAQLMNPIESRSYEDRIREWTRRSGVNSEKHLRNNMAADAFIADVIGEMQQLASRLLVRNQDLYGRYDRQMAEASLRMNVSIPLTVLLVLGTWLSGLPLWMRIALTLVSLSFGFMLLRQGFLRAISARDVIVQALIMVRFSPAIYRRRRQAEPLTKTWPDAGSLRGTRLRTDHPHNNHWATMVALRICGHCAT
jgi:hypothetical protein